MVFRGWPGAPAAAFRFQVNSVELGGGPPSHETGSARTLTASQPEPRAGQPIRRRVPAAILVPGTGTDWPGPGIAATGPPVTVTATIRDRDSDSDRDGTRGACRRPKPSLSHGLAD
jgi:hypothetical protein